MKGILLGLVSVLMWSAVFVMGRLVLVKYSLALVHFAWMRYAIAGPLLLGMVLAQGRGKALLEELRRPWGLVTYAAMGATGCFGMSYFQVLALPYSQATTISMLMATAPLFTLVAAIPLGEKITSSKVASLILGFSGAGLITYAMSGQGAFVLPGPFPYYGELMILLSGASWGIYTVLGKRPSARVGGLSATTLAVLFGNLLFLPAIPLIIDGGMPCWQALLALGFEGVGGTAIGFATWYAALKYIEAGKLSMLQFLSPVLAYLQASVILGERITLQAAFGFVLVAVGVFFIVRSKRPKTGIEEGRPVKDAPAAEPPPQITEK